MRRTLALAVALIALAVPAAATPGPERPGAATPDRAAVTPVVISITVQNGRPVGGIKRPSVKKGRTIRFVIRTNLGRDVHLHGYDLERVVRKGTPTALQFVARIPGRFELELHHPDAVLAQLTVRP